jgi:DNA topoisomerase-1
LEQAVTLLTLPREIGIHPDGGAIASNLGRFGPYVMHQLPDEEKPVYANLKETLDVFEIGMNRAMEMITEKRNNPGRGRRAAAKALRELGEHPDAGGPVNIMDGRYGAYVKWDKVNATIPKEVEVKDVTMEQAVEWIAEKSKKKPTRKAAAKKKPAAKKKAPAKKTAGK